MKKNQVSKEWLNKELGYISEISSTTDLENAKKRLLSKKSPLKLKIKTLPDISNLEKRKRLGKKLNEYENTLIAAINDRRKSLNDKTRYTNGSHMDITRPGIKPSIGYSHPVTTVMDELIDYFISKGFDIAEGPEIETDWYCFEALNIPPHHAARDMQDTFYLESGAIPRTHTSSVQIRYMENNKPPIRIIAPGKAYRNEDEDSTHSWSFYQLEGLVVDENINLGHLKGTLLGMIKAILGEDAKIRLRPNYFPYVEPALEVDVGIVDPKTKEINWLEMLGAGMVHNQVLKNVNIADSKYTGFAFGLGIERLASVKYGISDVREFWRPDFNFLEQF